jgi:hypothetical protein
MFNAKEWRIGPRAVSRGLNIDERIPAHSVVRFPNELFSEFRAHPMPRRAVNLDSLGRPAVSDIHNVIHMIAHCDKQVEEHSTTNLHLHLHGATPLERLA